MKYSFDTYNLVFYLYFTVFLSIIINQYNFLITLYYLILNYKSFHSNKLQAPIKYIKVKLSVHVIYNAFLLNIIQISFTNCMNFV